MTQLINYKNRDEKKIKLGISQSYLDVLFHNKSSESIFEFLS